MRALVTCGAGFIGTHVVRESIRKQAHGGRLPDLPAGTEIIPADCADRRRRGRALAGVDRAHLAAIVGVGRSMYEIVRYTQGSTMSTAVASGKPNAACGGHATTSESRARDDVTDGLSA